MSFLTKGKWNRTALVFAACGFDPRAVVRAAVLNGTLPAPRPAAPRGRNGHLLKHLTAAARLAARRAASLTAQRHLRAERSRLGLNRETGKPLQRQKHPELRGLSRKEYRRRWTAQRRTILNSQLP